MSPEQVAGEQLDGRSDLFSLGVVLYESATGHHPFPGKTAASVVAAILNQAPVPALTHNPDIPLRLQETIENCLEKDRELRYQSAADLRADLKRVRRDIDSGHSMRSALPGQVAASRSSGSDATLVRASHRVDEAGEPSSGRSGRPMLAAGALLAFVLIGLVAFAAYRFGRPTSAPPETAASVDTAAAPDPVAERVPIGPGRARRQELQRCRGAGRGNPGDRAGSRGGGEDSHRCAGSVVDLRRCHRGRNATVAQRRFRRRGALARNRPEHRSHGAGSHCAVIATGECSATCKCQ